MKMEWKILKKEKTVRVSEKAMTNVIKQGKRRKTLDERQKSRKTQGEKPWGDT